MISQMLIGSRAIAALYPEFKRTPADTDYCVWDKDLAFISQDIQKYYIPCLPRHEIIPMDALLTLKVSHAIRDIHWYKNIYDVKFLFSKGHFVQWDLLQELLDYWNEVHGPRRTPDFTMNNEEFFSDHVPRVIPHDELHELFKYGDRPAFEQIKYDLDKAEVSENLFYGLSPEERDQIILEEAYVLAYERHIQPNPKYSPGAAFKDAIHILITRLLPEFLAIYAVFRILHIDTKQNINQFRTFLKTL
jgi:hypothetical protein